MRTSDRVWATAMMMMLTAVVIVVFAQQPPIPELKKAEVKANEIALTKNELNDLQALAKKAAAIDDDKAGLLEQLKTATKKEREGIATELQAALLSRDRMEQEYLLWLNNARKAHECPECQLSSTGKTLIKPETKVAPSGTKPPIPETKPAPNETKPAKKETPKP